MGCGTARPSAPCAAVWPTHAQSSPHPRHRRCTVAHLASQCAPGSALLSNYLYILRYALEKGAPPDARARGGNCPIHLAAAAGSVEAVKLLLHFNADAYVLNEQGLSPLQASLC